jgi:lysozyme
MPNAMVIDLSHHNANPDFVKARADGVIGVIHKATQGTGFVDDKYAPRKTAALAANLLWGAYHFGTGDNVNAQVSHFIDTVRPDGSFVLVLDFEKNTTPPMNSMSLNQAKQFLTAVEQQTGQKPVLYTGSFLTDTCGSAAIPDLAQYRVWWARYSNTPHLHATWQNYWLWQYSDGINGPNKKSVNGIGNCDCNTFNGDEAALRASWLA